MRRKKALGIFETILDRADRVGTIAELSCSKDQHGEVCTVDARSMRRQGFTEAQVRECLEIAAVYGCTINVLHDGAIRFFEVTRNPGPAEQLS